jgi:hypothetical protein
MQQELPEITHDLEIDVFVVENAPEFSAVPERPVIIEKGAVLIGCQNFHFSRRFEYKARVLDALQ